MLPGDGTRIDLEHQPGAEHGLTLHLLKPSPEGLRDGDIVLEIDGQRIDALVSGLFKGQWHNTASEAIDPLRYSVLRRGRALEVPVHLSAYPVWTAFRHQWSIFVFLGYLEVIGLLVFLRRPRLPVVQLFFLLSSAIFASGITFFIGVQVNDFLRSWVVALWLWGSIPLYGLLNSSLLHFSLEFPIRRSILKRRPRLLLWVYLGPWLPYLAFLLIRLPAVQGSVERFALMTRATGLMTITYFPLAMISALRFFAQSSRDIERRQGAWLVWGFVIAAVPWLVLSVGPALVGADALIGNATIGLLWCVVPTTFAIAVLRERLFDIDVLINRTLIYGALSVVLALLYFASVVLFQTLLPTRSQLAVVISTLLIAALFNPIRMRVQSSIDQRFYRQKYDAQRALNAFSDAVRDEVDLDKLVGSLMALVEETMQPAHASLWLREPD